MAASMTGFGFAQVKNKKHLIQVQIKSVNGRFLETKFKMPRFYQAFEADLKTLVSKKVFRGTLEVLIYRSEIADEASAQEVQVNKGLAQAWIQAQSQLAQDLDLSFKASVEGLMRVPDVFTVAEKVNADDEEKKLVIEAIEEALKAHAAEKSREGKELQENLLKLINDLSRFANSVEEKVSNLQAKLQENLLKKLNALKEDIQWDSQRMSQEVLYMVERADIEEEITRLKSHLDGFKKTLHEKGSIGKKLDFIVQELHREVNTMGSKSQSLDVMIDVIEAKTCIEKIREQVQNIE